MERFGFAYTLRKVDGRWKVIVGAMHDTETVLQLE
jgi:hypothetical protein